MEKEEGLNKAEWKEKIFQIFKDFMTRVTKLEELGAVGSGLLGGFQQGLEFLRRPPINRKSELIDNIIKANETERVKSYMAAGCISNHDSMQSISKLHRSLLGLHDHITKEMGVAAKSIINELEILLADLSVAITSNGSFSPLWNEDLYANLDQEATSHQEEASSSDFQELEMTDYAALMGIIYSTLKQDYVMQERIVASLHLKSLPGEVESYCFMWSLRPYINDEILRQAWKHVH